MRYENGPIVADGDYVFSNIGAPSALIIVDIYAWRTARSPSVCDPFVIR